MNVYIVQEFLAVLVLLAVSAAAILVFAFAFILFQEGIRRAAIWAKTDVIRLAGLSPRNQRIRRTDGQSALHHSAKMPNGLIVKKQARFQLTR